MVCSLVDQRSLPVLCKSCICDWHCYEVVYVCIGSDTNTRGVVHYVQSQSDLEWLLHHSPHPPYIALMEPAPFTRLATLSTHLYLSFFCPSK